MGKLFLKKEKKKKNVKLVLSAVKFIAAYI